MNNAEVAKPIAVIISGIASAIITTIPFAFVLLFAVVLDCLSAFDLSRRLKKRHPDRVTGKFRSDYALKMLRRFIQMYGFILLVFLVEALILPMHQLNMANYASAICCFAQGWSVLENVSSENDATWAKVLQKIMVNKAERHFDIKLTELKKEEENNG